MGVLLILLIVMVGGLKNRVESIGANWGTQASHPLPPTTVVKMLRDNGLRKVKLFDAEARVLNALSGSGIEVMVGIPNDMLQGIASSMDAADTWVQRNVSAHSGVDIKYVAVGNEPFLSTYNGSFLNSTIPALRNIQAALVKAGLSSRVKVTCPLNADVYETSTDLPSGGDFRADIHDLMLEIVNFLSVNGGPFTVNIYPFISLYNDANFPVDYAYFGGFSSPINDNGRMYTNVFDANHDTLISALERNGLGNMTIIVGEIGWPTDGNEHANIGNAQRFNQGFMSHVNGGTPLRPGPVDAYLFSLIDEDAKSVQPGNFERHWGIFNFDGTPKYNLSLGSSRGLVGASNVHYLPRRWCVLASPDLVQDAQVGPSVNYACDRADCTSLGYGTSCSNLDAQGNISFAFNSYYQEYNQLETACRFPNLSVITTTDPSVGTCRFKVMIQLNQSGAGVLLRPQVNVFQMLVFATTFLLSPF